MSLKRRDFLKGAGGLTVGALGAGVLGGGLSGRAAQRARRPNIVLLFSDDQRADAVGYAGNAVIETPEMDRLAAESVVFENAFVTTPICAVSRANVFSGQWSRRHGIDDFVKAFSDEQMDATYPALLRSAGYWTGFIGKWGIAANQLPEVDRAAGWFDFWAGASHQTNFWHGRKCRFVTSDAVNDKTNNRCDCHPSGVGERLGFEGIEDPIHQTTQIVPLRVQQFLAAVPEGRPFCLSVSFKTPHWPFADWPLELEHIYDDKVLPVGETATPEDSDAQPAFLRRSLGSAEGARMARDHSFLRDWLRDYYRLVTAQDRAVGSIRAALAEAGVADDTIIILMGDHGAFFGEHGFFGKWLLHEESIRTPCLIHDPRRGASVGGTRRDEMVLEVDLAPTMLELAGLPVPEAMQGRSLAPLLDGPAESWRDEVYLEHTYTHHGRIEASRGVRTTRWKYMRYFNQLPVVEQLFDLEHDPIERHNLAGAAEHAATLDGLRARCAELRAELGPPTTLTTMLEAQPDRVIAYKQTAQRRLHAHVFAPEGGDTPRPAIAFFHGGGWRDGRAWQFYPHCAWLKDRGMVGVCFEYRMTGHDKTGVIDCVRDARSAMRWLRAHAGDLGIDPDRIAAGGGSAGGHLALATAALGHFDDPADDTSVAPRPDALVVFNPCLDTTGPEVAERFGLEDPEGLSVYHHAGETLPPTLILHGHLDDLVPITQVNDFAGRMRELNVDCSVASWPGRGHGWFNYRKGQAQQDTFWQTVRVMDRWLVERGWLEADGAALAILDERGRPGPIEESP